MHPKLSPQIIEIFQTNSVNETRKLSEKLGKVLKAGDNVALTGNLGAGKTHMAQGIALGVGLTSDNYITSPTFTLIDEHYLNDIIFYHMDLYRLNDIDELLELDFHDIIRSGNISVVEWWDLFPETIPSNTLIVAIDIISENSREILMASGKPENWTDRLSNIR
ncbi:MAG: tRNA (adenosine(37)-N6)-threonylcarbamoyltransferase complex ATPase subunit type 1 TsaE [Deltaproteobacteria bacterium]|nr:tRNA (adenosine(37)-N6)-threonylcarbamoyltransferase complex ATPase subunit type 1 TsaE [Deltaproteobacteria bacterium]